MRVKKFQVTHNDSDVVKRFKKRMNNFYDFKFKREGVK